MGKPRRDGKYYGETHVDADGSWIWIGAPDGWIETVAEADMKRDDGSS